MATVTIFPNAKTPSDPYYVDSAQLVEYIRDGRWKAQIDTLNSFNPDTEQQKSFKSSQIPAIVWQGQFTYRNADSITAHSGLVAIDIDHLPPDELDRYRKIITANKYTHILFTSPRRNGLKVIIKIPADINKHKEYVAAIGDQYRKHATKYYDHYDDICRSCFVSYDPDIYFNPDSEVFTDHRPLTVHSTGETSAHSVAEDSVSTFKRIRSWADKYSSYTDGNKHNHLIKLFTACNRAGVPKDDAIKLAFDRYAHTEGTQPVAFADFTNRADSVYRLYEHDFGTKVFTEELPQPEPASLEPEPRPTDSSEFPIEVFPESIQLFINILNASLNYPKDFLAVSVMFAMATLNGNAIKLRVKNEWVAPTIFWFAVVGDPGTMKSHPIKTVLNPIKEIDRQSKYEYDQQYSEYEQELLNTKTKNQAKRPVYRQILINDITLESLHEVHGFNKRGLGYYRDELVGFLFDMNRYHKGSDEQFWLESFNNGSYTVNRVSKRPCMIEDTNINIIGSIQPDVFSNVAKQYRGNGMVDRFLYTLAEHKIPPMTSVDVDPALIAWWEKALFDINKALTYTSRENATIIDLSKQAEAAMIKIDIERCRIQESEETPPSLKTYLSKAKTYLPRFTLLLVLFDYMFANKPLVVTESHVTRANQIMQYFIESSKAIFSEADRAGEMGEIISANRGANKREKIIALHKKGYKNADIAKVVGVGRSYVSRLLSTIGQK